MGLARWPLRMLSPAGARARLVILTFHRVLATPDALLPDEPDVVAFRRQMEWLRELCVVLPLPEAAERLRTGKLPERACCITFDDGYANNLEVAVPVLRELGLPATVYIAVEAVERGIMWNDLVIEGIRRAGRPLTAAEWGRIGMAGGTSGSGAALVQSALSQLKYQATADRWEAAVDFYRHLTGAEPPRLMLTPDAVAALARAGIDVGAHTVRHPILKTLPADEARREIVGSRDWIAAAVGRQPRSFAYPNGRPEQDYDASHAAMVRDAGFTSAVSTAWGCARAGADLYQLPRLTPWDRTPTRYALRLCREYLRSYAA